MGAADRRTLYERIDTPIASSRPGAWFYVNLAPYIDRPLMRLAGGRLTTGGIGRVGLLKCEGAKTGRERHTPLVFTRDGENVILVASRGGDVKHPAWYRNPGGQPGVRFFVDGEERPYRARDATDEERPRLWRMVNRTYAGYAAYQRRAGDRQIPLIVLEPRAWRAGRAGRSSAGHSLPAPDPSRVLRTPSARQARPVAAGRCDRAVISPTRSALGAR